MLRVRCLVVVSCSLISFARPVHAYCLKTTCNGGAGRRCVPSLPGDCGIPLAWPHGRARYWIQPGGAVTASSHLRAPLLDRAFSAWAAAGCAGGTHPSIDIVRNAIGAESHGVVSVSDDGPVQDHGALAITDLTFDPKTGDIRGARMTLFRRQLEPLGVTMPVMAIALHEAGHFLGIAHANDPDAVMTEEVDDGTMARTELTADDAAAICAAYPPAASETGRDPSIIATSALDTGAWICGVIAVLAGALRYATKAARRSAARPVSSSVDRRNESGSQTHQPPDVRG